MRAEAKMIVAARAGFEIAQPIFGDQHGVATGALRDQIGGNFFQARRDRLDFRGHNHL
jgi:hypothetical protein